MSFLSPRVERLDADGRFEVLDFGGPLGRLRPTVVLIARDLCTFSLFETASLPATQRRPAARLHARASAPYVTSAAILVRCGADFGVWSWDLTRVTPMVAARHGTTRPVVRPETLAQPAAVGWRIVKLARGYEAQYWRDGSLAASAWRLDRFDNPAWEAFARVVRGASPAPDTPPTPIQLPIAPDSEALSLARIELSRNQALGMAAGTLATGLACSVLFMLGQGLQLRSQAAEIVTEAATIREATPRAGETRGLEIQRRQLAAYREAEERTNPVTAMGAAIGIVSLYDLTPTAVEVADGKVIMTLPYAAVRRIDDLVPEFEGSGYFFDVRPRTDAAGQTLVIEMNIREAAPPLTAGE